MKQLITSGIAMMNLFFTSAQAQGFYFQTAKPEQAAFLTQLAMDSNNVYQYRSVPDEEAIKVFLVTKEHFERGIIRLMMLGEEIIGFYGLFSEEKEGKTLNILSHFFLKPEYIGKGFGRKLFEETMRAAKEEMGWEGLLWESDPNAAWFYKKMGAKQIGENPCPLNPAYKAPVFIYALSP